MGDLTANVSRYEIACKCGCGFDTMDQETLDVLQECANYFADLKGISRVRVTIHSGCRCRRHNSNEGGADKSQHLYARAIDFHIQGVRPQEVYDYLIKLYPNRYGIGCYSSFVHLDTRTKGFWRQDW